MLISLITARRQRSQAAASVGPSRTSRTAYGGPLLVNASPSVIPEAFARVDVDQEVMVDQAAATLDVTPGCASRIGPGVQPG